MGDYSYESRDAKIAKTLTAIQELHKPVIFHGYDGEWLICGYCDEKHPCPTRKLADEGKTHLEKAGTLNRKPRDILGACPVCNTEMYARNIKRHIQTVHKKQQR